MTVPSLVCIVDQGAPLGWTPRGALTTFACLLSCGHAAMTPPGSGAMTLALKIYFGVEPLIVDTSSERFSQARKPRLFAPARRHPAPADNYPPKFRCGSRKVARRSCKVGRRSGVVIMAELQGRSGEQGRKLEGAARQFEGAARQLEGAARQLAGGGKSSIRAGRPSTGAGWSPRPSLFFDRRS
jgi:hypothetical protein